MSTNSELAEILRGIADLLDLQGERFKPAAYRRAAQSIDSLPDDVRQMSARGELRTIPGVGDAIAEKIREYLRDGHIPYYERLSQEVPAGVRELMRLPGVGPKTARRFLTEFGIQGPAELAAAIDAGKLEGAAGFKERKIAQLKQAVAAGTPSGVRTPLKDAWQVAEDLVRALRANAPVEQIVVAGSLRRRRETVGDLDILVTSGSAEAVFNAFSALPGVVEIRLRGPTKETVIVRGGLQVDLRVVEPASFGAALQYFTGSKEHNVAIRTRARDLGLKINEYGVVRGEERVAGVTEEEVYGAIGLRYIPPEIRENLGEIELAEKGTLPALVEPHELHGDLHVHLSPDAGPEEVDRLRQEAVELGWSFLGFVTTHPPGTLAKSALDRIEHWRQVKASGPRVLLGQEASFGAAVGAATAEYTITNLTGVSRPPTGAPTSASRPLFAGHLGVATAASAATVEGLTTWIKWAGKAHIGLEVGPRGAGDGLDSAGVRQTITAGIPIHITAGVTGPADHLRDQLIALGLARRGWATADRTLNRTLPGAA
ncbi:MAG: helix-hairpin-helix domain-containing protein [Thermoplasmata archaeon]|nr:helix-hairpin-helix domain-containing protein [Thermoplasmata archaeon]